MRRAVWGAAVLVVAIVLGNWWITRDAIRVEPLDAQRFARLSEAEQVEWLIEQAIARSEARSLLPSWWERFVVRKRPTLGYLTGVQCRVLGNACARRDLPHLLNRLPARAENAKAVAFVQMHRAEWHAYQGRAKGALRQVDAIRLPEMCALAHARLGRIYLQRGDLLQAQRHFEIAQQSLQQSASPTHPEVYLETLIILLEQTRLYQSPKQVADLMRKLPSAYHNTRIALRVGDIYLQRGAASQLRVLAEHAPPKLLNAFKPALAAALVQQGEVEQGVALAQRLANQGNEQGVLRLIEALMHTGRADLARNLWLQEVLLVERRIYMEQITIQLLRKSHSMHFFSSQRYDIAFGHLVRIGVKHGWLREAAAFVGRVASPEARVLGRLELAAGYARKGNHQQAEAQIDLALADFLRLQHAIPLRFAIISLREAGAQSLATRFLNGARDYAQQQPTPQLRNALLQYIAGGFALNGQLSEAVRTIALLPDLNEQRNALVSLVLITTPDS